MKSLRCFVCCLLASLLLMSCGHRSMGAEEILAELMAECDSLPEGKIYVLSAEEGSEGYFSAVLAKTMYGDEAEELFSLIEDGAIYLSSAAIPGEIAVFCCYSATDALAVAQMCLHRAEDIRVALQTTRFEGLAENPVLLCEGRTVVMAITESSDAVEERGLRIL